MGMINWLRKKDKKESEAEDVERAPLFNRLLHRTTAPNRVADGEPQAGQGNDDESTAKSKHSSGNGIAGAALLGGALLAVSMPARANWISDLANKAAKAISDAVKPIFDEVMGMWSQVMNSAASENSDRVKTAVGANADAINNVAKSIDDAQLKRATMPSPDPEASDKSGKDSGTAAAQAQAKGTLLQVDLLKGSLADDPAGFNAVRDYENQSRRYVGDKKGLNMSPSAIGVGVTSIEGDDVQTAIDFRNNVIGSVGRRSISDAELKHVYRSGDTLSGNRMNAKIATEAARAQLAALPINQFTARRDASDGPSVMEVFEREVARTFGDDGTGWRKAIAQYADPTPLLEELNRTSAFHSALLLQQIKIAEEGNLTLSAIATSLIEQTNGGTQA